MVSEAAVARILRGIELVRGTAASPPLTELLGEALNADASIRSHDQSRGLDTRDVRAPLPPRSTGRIAPPTNPWSTATHY
jgi:hypothetical protein